MSANDPLTKRRKDSDDSKTRVSPVSWEQHGRYLLTGHAGSGVQAAWLLSEAFVRNLRAWLVMVREKAQVEAPWGRKYRCANQSRTAQ